MTTIANADHDEENRFIFNPPLCKQRDDFVYNILSSENSKSVLDLGCGECRFLQRLKRLPIVEKIVGVEKLKYLISGRSDALKPLLTEYLVKRNRPLEIYLYCGDVTTFDDTLQHFDAAVLIEVVEHLLADELLRLPATLFGAYQPKLVIITTPNYEFNICFNNGMKLRHWDHKFEWTRYQFQQWCSKICIDYSYCVSFDGVGRPSDNHPGVGHCTQIAIFRKSKTIDTRNIEIKDALIQTAHYERVGKVIYPWIGSDHYGH